MAKAKKKAATSRWADGTIDIEELSPAERLAHELVTDFADLAPSVEKIMDAEFDGNDGEDGDDQDGRATALDLFRASLDSLGDPNRDPRVAIEAAGGTPPPYKTD
ncbi:MAG: hypothetical protein HKN41_00945 [Ilumatobacter sp.]|nr:hypothetical protein [Ilumatobacter sp.]